MRRPLALAAVIVCLLAGSARADTTITFDDLAPGSTVTGQYTDLGGAGMGVTFGPLPGGAASPTYRPLVANVGTEASSLTNVANLANCLGCEFYAPEATATFAVPRTRVSVRVGYLFAFDPLDPCADPLTDVGCAVVMLEAFDADGNVVATSPATTVSEGAGVHASLSVSTTSAVIVGIRISSREPLDDNKSIAIDDLTYDLPGSVSPDFTLTASAPFTKVLQGGTTLETISVGRIAGSTGRVSLALVGALPAGVHAAIDPNPVTGTTATVTLTADGDAPPTGASPATVQVVGTPLEPSAGSATHRTPITITVGETFRLALAGAGDADVSRCVVSVPLAVVRDLTFPGPVSLSATGMKGGVTAGFAPAQATFPHGEASEQVALVVSAADTGFAVPAQTITVHATVPGLPERTADVTVHGACPAAFDARITSMQITQGTQSSYLPSRPAGGGTAITRYDEIPNRATLIDGAPTAIRVYADLSFGPSVPNVTAQLRAYRPNRVGTMVEVAGGPLLPVSPARTLSVGPAAATVAEEISPSGAFTFSLPASWASATTLFVASLVVPQPGQTSRSVLQCQTPECVWNDSFSLARVPFSAVRTVTIHPVSLTTSAQAPLPDAAAVFAKALLQAPFVKAPPYEAFLDISRYAGDSPGSNDANEDVIGVLDDWDCDHIPGDNSFTMGVNTLYARGLKHGHLCFWQFAYPSDAVVEQNRPLSSVGHEMFHLLGRPHASKACGGGTGGQTGESWPPDEIGLMQSIGINLTPGSGASGGGPYAILAGEVDPVNQWFDFMSYCDNGNEWVSVHNWNAVVDRYAYHGPVQLAPAPRLVRQLRVIGFVRADGSTRIGSVARRDAPRVPDTGPAEYTLVGRGADGSVVAQAPMRSAEVHVERGDPLVELLGYLPATTNAARLEIVHASAVVATAHASAHAPTAAIVAPVPGARLAGRRVTIRLRAADADRDPLNARLAYSRDGGMTWRTIWSGPPAATLRLARRTLARSTDARLRLTVSDGFRETVATSGRFRSAGAPPTVTIAGPTRLAQPADAPVVLRGDAYDDAGRALTGNRLTWLVDGRAAGAGSALEVAGLRAGRHLIGLRARDASGRRSTVTVRVVLGRRPPAFLTLTVPPTVRRGARRATVTVASSQASTLTITGGTHTVRAAVDGHPRTISVRLRTGRTTTLRFVLRASGGTTKAVRRIARR